MTTTINLEKIIAIVGILFSLNSFNQGNIWTGIMILILALGLLSESKPVITQEESKKSTSDDILPDELVLLEFSEKLKDVSINDDQILLEYFSHKHKIISTKLVKMIKESHRVELAKALN
jgi:hypothetical protein